MLPEQRKQYKILVMSHSTKLPGDLKGLDRESYMARILAKAGYQVELVTSNFQHWEKQKRKVDDSAFDDEPFGIVRLDEPGYFKNVDPVRIASHAVFAHNLGKWLEGAEDDFDVVLFNIPPNQTADVCAKWARANNIPYIVDVTDLWPEAMEMVFSVPIASDIAYEPLRREAARIYAGASAVVGTSDEYAGYPKSQYGCCAPAATIYVGSDISVFDDGVAGNAGLVDKPVGEVWAAYAGTLGTSYDLENLIVASAMVPEEIGLRVKIIGDGPEKEGLEEKAAVLGAPVDFLGYRPYGEMAAWLSASDMLVNSLREDAPQSIPSKISDYLAAGKPIVNTGASAEMKSLLEDNGCGVNVKAGDAEALALAMAALAVSEDTRAEMGFPARLLAERRFDRRRSYLPIVAIADALVPQG